MNENENVMSREESLSIISGMINNARNKYSETGHYIYCGVLLFLSVALHSL